MGNAKKGAAQKRRASGMGFNSRADQISHMLPTTRRSCNLKVWALAQSRGDGHHSLVTPERVLSEYNKDLIFFLKIYSATFCHCRGHL